jgi:tetratricopeptide (TPR) repeat protein
MNDQALLALPQFAILAGFPGWLLSSQTTLTLILTACAIAVVMLLAFAVLRPGKLVVFGYWSLGVFVSILWSGLLGDGDAHSTASLASAAATAFALGCIVGFVFSTTSQSTTNQSTTNQQESSIAKVRDWMVGGVTGLGVGELVAQGSHLKAFIQIFSPGNAGREFGLTAATMVVFFVGGFLAMYLNRVLVLNILLTRAEKTRSDIESGRNKFDDKVEELAASALVAPVGTTWETEGQQEAIEVDTTLQSFASSVELALTKGESVKLTDIERVAGYYTSTFQRNKLVDFLRLAFEKSSLKIAVAFRLAKALADVGNYEKAVQALKDAQKVPNAPASLKKVIGFYLLWLDDEEHLRESLKSTEEYLKTRPDDDGATFNKACAYAQLYCKSKNAKCKDAALTSLQAAIDINSAWKTRARELTGLEGDFACFKDDSEFLEKTKE